jgi:hypothetical protein
MGWCCAGVVKDWLLIGLSALLYSSPVTKLNLIGYGIAFVAVLWCALPWHTPNSTVDPTAIIRYVQQI